MAGLTRRDLLKAGAGASALALGSSPLVERAMGHDALARHVRTGELNDIEHVIILIQENRSFDHYFGMLPGVRGYGDKTAQRSIFEQPGYPVEGYEGKLLPFHASGNPSTGLLCFKDITHSWRPQHESWAEGAMDGFVQAHLAWEGVETGSATMAYYEREDIPYYYALAENFTICDNYYCSVLGPTYPNRVMAMSGGIDPEGLNGGPIIGTLGDFEYLKGRFTWPTMAEQLSAHGVSWKSYTGLESGFSDNALYFFKNCVTDPELKKRAIEPVYPTDFVNDLKHGELPQVSWIATALAWDEHPGYQAAKVGEWAVENLLARLHMHGYWDKCAVFLTYDENGGFFDHVVPPTPPPGTAGEYLTAPAIGSFEKGAGYTEEGIAGPIGLGFRVPLLVISPFSRGGFLCSETADHTSLLRFLETRFGVEVPNLSEWRRETTGDLTGAFNFASKPDESMGKLPKEAFDGKVSETQIAKGRSRRDETAREEIYEGGCNDDEAPEWALPVPPNSFPQQEQREWRRPSGLA